MENSEELTITSKSAGSIGRRLSLWLAEMETTWGRNIRREHVGQNSFFVLSLLKWRWRFMSVSLREARRRGWVDHIHPEAPDPTRGLKFSSRLMKT